MFCCISIAVKLHLLRRRDVIIGIASKCLLTIMGIGVSGETNFILLSSW
jgi:hypothetical protein